MIGEFISRSSSSERVAFEIEVIKLLKVAKKQLQLTSERLVFEREELLA